MSLIVECCLQAAKLVHPACADGRSATLQKEISLKTLRAEARTPEFAKGIPNRGVGLSQNSKLCSKFEDKNTNLVIL